MIRRNLLRTILPCSLLLAGLATAQTPVGTAFTYQGRLTDNGAPATGTFDIELTPYDDPSDPAIGPAIVIEDVSVVAGLFRVTADFGDIYDTDARWIGIGVRDGASVGSFTALSPRRELTPVPFALNAGGIVGGYVDLTTNQTIAGNKSFTDEVAVDETGVSTASSGETGAVVSARGTADPAAVRAIGVRGRTLATTVTAASRRHEGVVGSVSSVGGALTSIAGGYFNGKVINGANSGVLSVSGVSADAEAEASATGFTALNFVTGGRFGATADNFGAASASGVVGTVTGIHSGSGAGVVGFNDGGSTTNNVGVAGISNATLVELLAINGGVDGVGVYAANPNPAGLALYADGNTNLDGDVSINGVGSQTGTPVAANDLATKGYVDSAVGAGGPFVDLTTNQTIGGNKSFTDEVAVDETNINTVTSGETGAGVSFRGTADPAAGRAIGIRGRILETTTQAAARRHEGVVGSVSSAAGPLSSVAGGYFNGKVINGATGGALSVSGVSADAEAEAGATGFVALNFATGGRFGVLADNFGAASASGVVGTVTGVHSGSGAGVVGFNDGGSTSNNVGVVGMSNGDLTELLAVNGGVNGVGVYAANPNPSGLALYADGNSSLDGNLAINGVGSQTGTPTNPSDLATKAYVDSISVGTNFSAAFTGRANGLPNDASTEYHWVADISNGNASQNNRTTLSPNSAHTARNLAIRLTVAPGVGDTRTFTLMVNGAATAVAVTISGTSITGNSGAATAAVPAGSTLALQVSGTGTPANAQALFGWELQ